MRFAVGDPDITLSLSTPFRMSGLMLAAAIFLALVGVSSTISLAQNRTTRIDISRMEPELAPDNFTFWRTGEGDAGEWRVFRDPTAINQKAIAQTSEDPTEHRFPLAVYEPISARDVNIVTRFRPIGGKVDQSGGIAVRLTTPDDYYVLRGDALADTVRFYRVVKGKLELIQGAKTKVAPNQWHMLALRAEGSHFTISFDGAQLFTATDETFVNGGKVALWTKADSVTYFDMIWITQLE